MMRTQKPFPKTCGASGKLVSGLLMSLILAVPAAVTAQIGSGWTEYFPETKLQQENSAGFSSYEKTNGVESFKLWKNPSGARQRCEIRVADDYTNGITQFEGEFFVVKGGGPEAGDDVCIMQVWLSMMVSISDTNGGSMYQHSRDAIVDHLIGKWVRMNVIHDADKRTGEIWIDGVKQWSGATKTSRVFYHKYGLYNQGGTSTASDSAKPAVKEEAKPAAKDEAGPAPKKN